MLDDELRELLRELVAATGAVSVAVVHERPAPRDYPERASRMVPLGSGAFLLVEFVPTGARLPGPLGSVPESGWVPPVIEEDSDNGKAGGRDLAIEHCARALRARARRWGQTRVPAVALSNSAEPPRERVMAQITAFLQALANTQNAVNALVAVRGEIIASAHPLGEDQRASVAFTQRRLTAEAERGAKSSHAELAGSDHYAVSFWYGACLIAFFSGPYAEDFMRHRVRLVTRELCQLLPLLDDPPPAGANVAPLPE